MSTAWEQEREKDGLKSHAKELKSSRETGDWPDDEKQCRGNRILQCVLLRSRGLPKAIYTQLYISIYSSHWVLAMKQDIR